MAVRPYARPRAEERSATEQRVMAAAEAMIEAGTFHTATVAELADRADVARATVFGRFGSKLGVLEALATRCAGGPTMAEIRAAFGADIADPHEAVRRVVAATCAHWEQQGYILLTLKAVVQLEPDAAALIDEEHEDQRQCCEQVVSKLDKANALRPGLRPAVAVALLHAITSVETFVELRRNSRLSLAATRDALCELAVSLLA